MRLRGATISDPALAGRPAQPVISVHGLTKHYGQTHAVRGIDLEVGDGEIFAFLGPNGAGKTTTVEILEGFRRPTDGRVRVLGVDPAQAGGAWRNRVGVVLQESEPEPGLTVRESLQLYAGYYRAPRDVQDTIALVGLAGKADTLGAQLSGGQRRRLDFALALIGDPELIFLDEPPPALAPPPAAGPAGAGRLGPGWRLRPPRPGRAPAHAGGRLPPPHRPGGTTVMLLIRCSRRLRARRAAGQPDAAASLGTGQPSLPQGGRGPLALVAHQVRYNLIPLTRNRQGGLVAAIGFPVIFLVLFVGVFGNHPVGAGHVKAATYYVPGIAALAVVVAAFTNLVTALVSHRESGILRRRRATPVPAPVLTAAQAVTTLLVSLAGVAVLLGIGRLAYGVTLHATAVPGVLLTTLVGSVAFTCLAYALSTAIGSVDSATPTVQAISLPLYFISGVFIPNADLPPWLQQVAKAFPVQHLANGLHLAFDPAVHGAAVPWTELAVLAVWGAAGLAVALRRFSWSPSTASTSPDDRRSARGPGGHAGRLGRDPEPGRVEVSRSTPAWPPSGPIPSAGQQQPQGPTAEGAGRAATPQRD